MNDMSQAIVPKSDQLNSDDLIAGPITITVTDVKIRPGTEQPVAISFEGDNGKPWKPCKSMSRVLVMTWGADAKKYTGRSLTLYRDPSVKWGGMEVGGIRISHLSHMETAATLVLTATKGSRKPYTVKPLATSNVNVATFLADYEKCSTKEVFDAIEVERFKLWEAMSKSEKQAVKVASDAAKSRLLPPLGDATI